MTMCFENHQTDARVRQLEVAPCIGAEQNSRTSNNNPLVVTDAAEEQANDAVMWDGSDVHPSLTCENAGGGQRMPDKGNFNGIIQKMPSGDFVGAMAQNSRDEVRIVGDGNVVGALAAEPGMKQTNYIAYRYCVRRITPVEAERLQGFADNWTRPVFTEDMLTDELLDRFVEIHANWNAINGKPDAKRKTRDQVRKWLLKISSPECPDGPRYKAVGNSMSVNVMQWIGMRIDIAYRSEEARAARDREGEVDD